MNAAILAVIIFSVGFVMGEIFRVAYLGQAGREPHSRIMLAVYILCFLLAGVIFGVF